MEEPETVESEEAGTTPDWATFLHNLGSFMASAPTVDGDRPCAIVVLPCLDYGSVITASGVVAKTITEFATPEFDIQEFVGRIGQPVEFLCKQGGSQAVKRMKGEVKGLDTYKGKERLLVRWLEILEGDAAKKSFDRAVPDKWLGLIRPLEDKQLNLDTHLQGSTIVDNIGGLEAIVGEGGIHELLQNPSSRCLLLDVKSRVQDEIKNSIPVQRLRPEVGAGELVLRDLVRLNSAGPEAMKETYCCKVSNHVESGWPVTVIAGSLNLLRGWNDCDSPVRIGIISPVENAFQEALEFANELFEQREGDFDTPEALLASKPAPIDFQLFFGD